MNTLHHIERALAYRARMASTAPGIHQIDLRRQIIVGPVTGAHDAQATLDRLLSYRIEDMPAAADDLSLLIDIIAMRHRVTSRAKAWARIGIHPDRGRDLLARNAKAIDWPIWFTAIYAATGKIPKAE